MVEGDAVNLFRSWLIGLIIILFLGSTLRLTETWASSGISIVYVSLILILLTIVFFKKKEIKYNGLAMILMYLFLVFGALSALVNGDARTLMRAGVFFFLFISANVLIPSYFKEKTNIIIAATIIVSHIPLLLIPLITTGGIDYLPYFGIFSNPNNLGVVTATVLAIFASLIFKDIDNMFFYKKSKRKRFMLINIIVIACLMLLISYSASRTSFVAALAIFFTGFLLVLIRLFQHKKLGNLLFKGFFISPIMVAAYFILSVYLPIQESIEDNILSKFERKSVDVLDGRGAIWEQTIDKAGFFGGGSDLFYGEIALGSHNTFVTVLGTYGWIPFIVIILFFALAAYHSIKHFLTSDSKYRYLAPMMLVAFLILSMTEDMHYKLSMIAILILSGVCMNQQKLRVK